jgi:hypothetical protein
MYLDLAQDEPVTFTIDLAAKIGEPFLVNSLRDPNFNKLIKGQKIEGNNIPANSVITRVVVNSQESHRSFIQISNNISGSGSDIIVIRNINISSINIAEYGDYAFSAQMVYSKNGLKLRHVLNGTTDELEDPEEPGEQEITPDGILYDTGFTIGEIHESIELKYRSNIDLNNITKYQAIKDIAESFDCIAVFNSIDNTVSFYPDKNEEIFDNNGLIITDKNYLTNISNDINALKIVTKAYAAGKNNLGIELISPNGSNAWEDYSYFLDSYYVEFDNTLDISLNSTTGIEFDDFPEGDLSRWMPQDEARAIAKWQYARDYFHEVMLGNIEPTGDLSYLIRYYDLYNIRSRGIDLLVKLESKYYERKATEYNLKYLYDFYVKDNENKTGAASRKKSLVYNFKDTTTFPVTTELPSGDFVFNSNNFTTVTKITIANFDNKSPGENARTFLASININNNPLLILSINSTDTNFVYYSVKGVDSVNTNSTQVVLDVEYSNQPGSDPLPTIYTNLTNITFRFRTWEEIYLIKYNQAKSASESAIKSLNRLSYILYNYRLNGTKIILSDSDYAELSAVQANSIATKMGEVQNYLRKINWDIDEEKIKFFQREAVMSDSKLDNELDLINATREFLVENSRPIITLSINIADFLASEQAILDWNRAKIGDIINIYYPEFNIDTTAQIRELNIDFQGNSLSFTISTYRYYGRQPLYFLSKQIRNLYDNEKNKTLYEYDENKEGSNVARVYKKQFGKPSGISGQNIGGEGLDVNTVDLNFGVESEEGVESDTSSEIVYSTTISGEGGIVSNVPTTDPILETVTFTNTKNIKITDGALLAVSQNEDFISEIEISGDNGIVIKKITGEDDDLVVTKQMYIDTDGNAVFSGFLSVNQQEEQIGYSKEGVFAGKENEVSKFSLKSEDTFLLFDPDATDYKLKISGSAQIGPLTIASADDALVAFSNTPPLPRIDTLPITTDIRTATFNFATASSNVERIVIETRLRQFGEGKINNRAVKIELFENLDAAGTKHYEEIISYSIIYGSGIRNEIYIFSNPLFLNKTIRSLRVSFPETGLPPEDYNILIGNMIDPLPEDSADLFVIKVPVVTNALSKIELGNFKAEASGDVKMTNAEINTIKLKDVSTTRFLNITATNTSGADRSIILNGNNINQNITYTLPNSTGTLVLNPMTAFGDIIYGGTVSNTIATPTRLAAGPANSVLTSNGTGTAPSWKTLTYTSRLANDLPTGTNTNSVEAFSFANLPIGTYQFQLIGQMTKLVTDSTSRTYQVIFSCDSTTGYSNIYAQALFSPNTSYARDGGTAVGTNMNHTRIDVVTANNSADTPGSFFQGTTNTTGTTNMPFMVNGLITLASPRNFRVHFRQTLAGNVNTVTMLAGSFMNLIKVA